MSCEDCEKAQEQSRIAYFRWDTAEIALKGCDKHLKEIFAILTSWQDTSCENKVSLRLFSESWQNLFSCLRNSTIKTEDNFWASVQELERQLQELKG